MLESGTAPQRSAANTAPAHQLVRLSRSFHARCVVPDMFSAPARARPRKLLNWARRALRFLTTPAPHLAGTRQHACRCKSDRSAWMHTVTRRGAQQKVVRHVRWHAAAICCFKSRLHHAACDTLKYPSNALSECLLRGAATGLHSGAHEFASKQRSWLEQVPSQRTAEAALKCLSVAARVGFEAPTAHTASVRASQWACRH